MCGILLTLLICGVMWGLAFARNSAKAYFHQACPRVAPSLPSFIGSFSVSDPSYAALARHAYVAAKQSCYSTDTSGWLPDGWELVTLLRDKNQQASGYVLRSPQEAVVAFRGTFSLPEAVATFKTRMTEVDEIDGVAGKVHEGFATRFVEFLPDLRDALKRVSDVDAVYFTGHSIGGVFAALGALYAGAILADAAPHVFGVSFGSPRIGDETFAEDAARKLGGRFVRVDNLYDIVVQGPVPLHTWKRDAMGFFHLPVAQLVLRVDAGNWLKNHSMRHVYMYPAVTYFMAPPQKKNKH